MASVDTAAPECPICMQYPNNPHEIAGCKHVYCRECIDSLRPTDSKLLCPLCRREFVIKDLRPVKLPAPPEEGESGESESEEEEEGDPEMVYCLKLTCKPGSGCKKVHIDDICPSPPQEERTKPKEEPTPKGLPPEPEDTFKLPEDATYCWDIECPGGSEATCGKIHESDIFDVAVQS
ncbi:hypothetical protein Aperf_G00000058036 [Anoplocephala perfoliata]